MNLKQFKDELAKTGVPFEMVEEAARPDLLDVIDRYHPLYKILDYAFDWSTTPEGFLFWKSVACGHDMSQSPEVAAWKAAKSVPRAVASRQYVMVDTDVFGGDVSVSVSTPETKKARTAEEIFKEAGWGSSTLQVDCWSKYDAD